jgi:hypothetical protein
VQSFICPSNVSIIPHQSVNPGFSFTLPPFPYRINECLGSVGQTQNFGGIFGEYIGLHELKGTKEFSIIGTLLQFSEHLFQKDYKLVEKLFEKLEFPSPYIFTNEYL